MPTKTLVTFETRARRLPKGKDIRIYLAGTIPELGYCKIDDTHVAKRLESNIQKLVKKRVIREWQRTTMQVPGVTGADDEDDDSEDSDDDTGELYEQALKSEVDRKIIASNVLAEVAVPLEEDPEDVGEAYLWASDPVTLNHPPGTIFSYLYFAWDLDRNRLWEIERFAEARELKIPPPLVKGENWWVCRCHEMNHKGFTLQPREISDSEDLDDISEEDSEEDSDDGLQSDV